MTLVQSKKRGASGLIAALAAVSMAAATLGAAPATAERLSKSEITEALRKDRYHVRDHDRSTVAVTAGEHLIYVSVFGSDGDVSFITYLAGLNADTINLDFINDFNNKTLFGRVYLDERSGHVVIQMDRNGGGGASIDNFTSDFDVFLQLIDQFKTDLHNLSLV